MAPADEFRLADMARLVCVLIPPGGLALVMIEAYFDESYSDAGPPVMVVAGYLVDRENLLAFNAEWAAMLTKYELPYFRMSALAHGNEPFDKLCLDQRIEVGKEAIAIINRRMKYGVSNSADINAFTAMIDDERVGEVYTFCARNMFHAVEEWADENDFQGQIAYFFEAGHKHQRQASFIMDQVARVPGMSEKFRYAGHSFVPKERLYGLQAADLFAWHLYTDHRHQAEVRPRRRDFDALLTAPLHWTCHWDADALTGIRALTQRDA